MKRKLISFFFTAVMLMACLLPVFATEENVEPDLRIRAAYWQDGMLYTFGHVSMEEPETQTMSLFVNNNLREQTHPVSVAEAQTPVHCMLLIDTSTSMPQNHKQILALAEKLMEADANVIVSVARFDRDFTVVAEGLTQWDAVKAALQSLSYKGETSDISGNVAEAIAYLGSEGYPEGELTNLIVITDGEPWYSNDREQEKEYEAFFNQTAQIMMAAYPEIVVHSYSFAPWQEALYETLSQGKGLHMVQTPAEEAGQALVDFVDTLYGINFPLKGYDNAERIPDSLMLSTDSYWTFCSNVRNAGITPQVELPKEEDLPTDPTEPAETADPTAPTENVDPTAPTETVDPTDPRETVNPTNPTDGQEPQTNSNEMVYYIVCIAGGCLLVVILLVIILSAKKKTGRGTGVRMCFQVVMGANTRLRKEYYLAREITIGSDKHSDIVVTGSGTEAACARIFIRGQAIFIEDMGSAQGTLVNGMRIFSSNRIRSGDEITVGMTTLRVMF